MLRISPRAAAGVAGSITVLTDGVRHVSIVLIEVEFSEFEEGLDPLGGDPCLHETVDDPREGIQGTDQDAEQRHTCEHLHVHK